MKQIPILFSTAMVQAILEGRKSQTRRIVKADIDDRGLRYGPAGWEDWHGAQIACPYGQPGDILWVREEHYRYGHWIEKEGVFTPTVRQKWMFVPLTDEVLYNDPESFRKGMHNKDPHTPAWHKRLARFMPKSACRLFLRNTGVRAERLQDISEMDAFAEGIDDDGDSFIEAERVQSAGGFVEAGSPAQHSFACLWIRINGPGSWEANPWVWVVCFECTEKPAA